MYMHGKLDITGIMSIAIKKTVGQNRCLFVESCTYMESYNVIINKQI